jgi:hypothetical protein
MNKYIAIYTHKKTANDTWKVFAEIAGPMAVAMREAKTPARCFKTWDPHTHGRPEVFFSMWEAEKPEDIITTMGALNDYVNTDLVPVSEIDWEQLASK